MINHIELVATNLVAIIDDRNLQNSCCKSTFLDPVLEMYQMAPTLYINLICVNCFTYLSVFLAAILIVVIGIYIVHGQEQLPVCIWPMNMYNMQSKTCDKSSQELVQNMFEGFKYILVSAAIKLWPWNMYEIKFT